MEFKFADNKTVASLDKVPEQFRGAYEDAGDGTFKLSDGATWAATAIDSLNGSLFNARNENNRLVETKNELTTSITAFKALGDDAVAVAATIKKLEDAATKGGENKVDLEAIRKEAQENLDKVMADNKAELEKERSAGRRTHAESQINGALVEHKVRSNMAPFLRDHVVKNVDVVLGDDGTFVARVKGPDGNHRSDGVGGFMTVQSLIKEMRGQEEFGAFFEGDGQSGSGTPPGAGTGTPPGDSGGKGRSAMDKISSGLKKRGIAQGA